MTTIAITGAGGFVGQRLALAALTHGYSVRAFVRQRGRAPEGTDAVVWDASEPGHDSSLLDGVDSVWHAAAHVPADHSDLSPATAERCFSINVGGTLRVLAACRAAGVTSFIDFSAANAYAPGNDRPDETWPLYPVTRAPLYLASKVAQEVIVQYESRRGALRACSLRLTAVYGPGQARGMLPEFARRLAAGQQVTLSDGGAYAADFVHVDDVAAAALAVHQRGTTGILNVGSGQRTSVLEFARALAKAFDADDSLIQVEPGPAEPPRGYPAVDITAAQRLLGFRPRTLASGLADYAAWCRSRDTAGGAAPARRE